MIVRQGTAVSVVTILFVMIFALPQFSGTAGAATRYVATNGSNTAPYDSWSKAATGIQTAISAANIGDTILVGSSGAHGTGFYTENVIVDKQLTIRSEYGSGATTIAAADSAAHVIEVKADNVTISGFSVCGGTEMWIDQTGGLHLPAGIYLENADGCTIESSRCGWDTTHQNNCGIHLVSSDKCVIGNNVFSFNRGQGIAIDSSGGTTVTGNAVTNNMADGIGLVSSSGNTFRGNTVSCNGLDGFIVGTSADNTFSSNIVSGNGNHGFQLFSSTDNSLTGNTADSNLIQGFYLVGSSNKNTLKGNTANSNAGVGIGLDISSGNTVTSNTVTHNQYGMFLGGADSNTIDSNIMNENDGRPDGDGIMLTGSSNNLITNNTMNNDPGDGIEFYESSNNSVIGNTVINSGWGIRINQSSSNNVLSNNTVNDGVRGIILEERHSVNNVLAYNTTNNNSEDGIFLYDSTSANILIGNIASDNTNHGIHINPSSGDNTIYLNCLIANKDNNVFLDDSNNTWHSPVAMSYDYDDGTIRKGYLGNYYSDGTHTGSNGIGGTYDLAGADNDDYQLTDTSGSYSLQAWWLNEDDNMYGGNPGKSGGSVSVGSGVTHVWTSNRAAPSDISFPGSGDWTGQVVFASTPASGHTFVIEIGSSSGESDFTAGGPDAVITGDGISTRFTFATDTAAFTLPAGKYLAFRVEGSDAEYSILTGGAWSFVSSPENSAGYLLPVESRPEIPLEFSLGQNYPNPFNPTTMINYQLPVISRVTLRVYDVLGREVETLVNGRRSAGEHSVAFSGADLPSGVYFCVLEVGSYRETKKMLLLK